MFALHTDLSDGADDGAVSAVFAHQINDVVCDFLNRNPAMDAVLSHMDGHMDFVIGGRREFTAHGDGKLRCNIFSHIKMPEFPTHLLHRHPLWHGVLVEGEGDVSAVALRLAECAYGRPVSRPTLALRGTRLDETLLIADRHTQLTWRTVPSTRAKHTARFRATEQLSACDNAFVTVASIAIFSPLCSINSNPTANHTRTSCDFLTSGSGSAWWTQAAVAVNFIHTGRAERTGRRLALIDVDAAVWSCKPTGALTAVPVIPVHTRPTVITWLWVAIIGILAAGGPFPAFFADAGEAVACHHTRGSVLTRVRQAAAVLGNITRGSFPSR